MVKGGLTQQAKETPQQHCGFLDIKSSSCSADIFDIAGVCARISVGVSINRRLAGALRTGASAPDLQL